MASRRWRDERHDRSCGRSATDASTPPRRSRSDVETLHGLVGNQIVQRLLGERPARTGEPRAGRVADPSSWLQRAPGGGSAPAAPTGSPVAAPAPAAPPATDYASLSKEELRTRYAFTRLLLALPPVGALAGMTGALRAEGEKIRRALVDKIVTEQVTTLLSQFRTISVFVPGTVQPMPAGELGPPAPKAVTFHAAYFINTATAKAHVSAARTASSFGGLAKALNKSGTKSVIESGGTAYGSGSAVRVGKATPDNVRQFMQAALDNGTIAAYGTAKGVLAKGTPLANLALPQISTLVQDWVVDNGVGVDCSGFVLQAAIRARDEVRAELRALGVPESQLPAEIGHGERKAKSFAGGTKVTKPTDLRPGDAWVLNSGKHVKIVTGAKEVTDAKGHRVIEIETAESAGDSTHTGTGPTAGTKRTKSLTAFGLGGSFHRI